MKKVNFITILVIIVLSACNKMEITSSLQKNYKLSIADFDYVGQLHNKGLDYSLKKIKIKTNSTNSGYLKRNKLIELQQKITSDYIKEQKTSNTIKIEALSEIKAGIKDFSVFSSEQKSSFNKFLKGKILPDTLFNKLSDNAQFLLLKIFKIAVDSDTNLNSLINRIDNIQQKAVNTLPINEQFFILSTASIEKYSLEYWKKNYNKWKLSSYTSKGKSAKNIDDINWKAAGMADVGGAAMAALSLAVSGTGAAMAATGPAGWSGIGLVVVGRGLQASAARMLWDL